MENFFAEFENKINHTTKTIDLGWLNGHRGNMNDFRNGLYETMVDGTLKRSSEGRCVEKIDFVSLIDGENWNIVYRIDQG